MFRFKGWLLHVFWRLVILALLVAPAAGSGRAQGIGLETRPVLAPLPGPHIDIDGPEGSGKFGRAVLVLPNGNIVVTDPEYDEGSTADVGAVYLLSGATGFIISWIRGSQAGDRVGAVVVMLSDGDYVISSTGWHNGTTADAGAVTWCDGVTGCSGEVTSSNSLVGSHTEDWVGAYIYAQENGNYVVSSPYWNSSRGAATWCSGSGGCSGVVSNSNSLVGSTADDQVGFNIQELSNGNYLVNSFYWDSPTAVDAGVVTWCNGSTGCSGVVSDLNSLVGSSDNDQLGMVEPLAYGNYLVMSKGWDNGGIVDAGVVAWCDEDSGCTGELDSTNSLVGSTANDRVGDGVNSYDLENGYYMVSAPAWDRGAIVDAGAVTWCDGTTGCFGVISDTNSLVGSTKDDQVGSMITVLFNGSYVVGSPYWDNGGIVDAGSVIWCHGYFGCQGEVSASSGLAGGSDNDHLGMNQVVDLENGMYVVGSPDWDRGGLTNAGAATICNGPVSCLGAPNEYISLVGSTTNDQVGHTVKALANGNYVVETQSWDNGSVVDAGAITWCSHTTGCTGDIDSTNSLVGAATQDWVGRVYPLSNGHYVVGATAWNNGGAVDAGAAIWCDGTVGCIGSIAANNSLVGSHTNDNVGHSITPLKNGNYVVSSEGWGDGVNEQVGASTFCLGSSGCSGAVSANNSLVGSASQDFVGLKTVELKSGNYLVLSDQWDNGTTSDAGAITWCSGSNGCLGAVSPFNSLVGSQTSDAVGYYPGYNNPIKVLDNGHYIVYTKQWDNTSTENAGAVSLGNGIWKTTRYNGPITLDNSVMGMSSNHGDQLSIAYDYQNRQLVVGRRNENIVSLFRGPFFDMFLPTVMRN